MDLTAQPGNRTLLTAQFLLNDSSDTYLLFVGSFLFNSFHIAYFTIRAPAGIDLGMQTSIVKILQTGCNQFENSDAKAPREEEPFHHFQRLAPPNCRGDVIFPTAACGAVCNAKLLRFCDNSKRKVSNNISHFYVSGANTLSISVYLAVAGTTSGARVFIKV